ncbi:hypothetical protein MCOR02_005318 [Pyricularia oryzae]|nr:hypothetical protein MCOR02_005318 [Pyricularia oryzae]
MLYRYILLALSIALLRGNSSPLVTPTRIAVAVEPSYWYALYSDTVGASETDERTRRAGSERHKDGVTQPGVI